MCGLTPTDPSPILPPSRPAKKQQAVVDSDEEDDKPISQLNGGAKRKRASASPAASKGKGKGKATPTPAKKKAPPKKKCVGRDKRGGMGWVWVHGLKN